jgi:hypothetical protein
MPMWGLADSDRPAGSRLRPGVRFYRGCRVNPGRAWRRLELPDGAVMLTLGFRGTLRVNDQEFRSALWGMRTRPLRVERDGDLHSVDVALAPWAAFGMFGIPLHELSERVVEPERILGERVRKVTGALASLPSWTERFRFLDTSLRAWADAGAAPSPRVVGAWNELVRTSGSVPIDRIAREAGWGRRQLEKRFREQIGLSPKAAARVIFRRQAEAYLDPVDPGDPVPRRGGDDRKSPRGPHAGGAPRAAGRGKDGSRTVELRNLRMEDHATAGSVVGCGKDRLRGGDDEGAGEPKGGPALRRSLR